MAEPTVEEQLRQEQEKAAADSKKNKKNGVNSFDPGPPSNKPQSFRAVFGGTYYKASGNGNDVEDFTGVTVDVPLRWAYMPDLHPIGMFKKHYASRKSVKGQMPKCGGVRTAFLEATEGLPEDLPFEERLKWTADYSELKELAQSRRESRVVKPELYNDPHTLRNAIQRAIAEPKAFVREQEARERSGIMTQQGMEDELSALGY